MEKTETIPEPVQTVDKDDYQFTFYPGFASRAVVRRKDGSEVELYKQEKPFKLPDGQKKPDTKHKIKFKGGKHQQDITLDIQDPGLRIARITVELYAVSPHNGVNAVALKDDGGDEAVVIENKSQTCPPDCDTPTLP
jgi:hypothetical protein